MIDRSTRGVKPIYEKENQQKHVNKRTDLLSSLHNIKLPLQHSQSLKENFQSVPSINSISMEPIEQINSYRELKMFSKVSRKELSLTQEYCKTYGPQVESALRKDMIKGKFLTNHKIDGVLRARMLDWMVEVMGSYHFQNKTYFAGIEIMDRFFGACQDVLVPTQLHIIGVQSMFIATKMQEVYPLKMKTVFQKIAHKKISIQELSDMECKIAQQLNFALVSSTIYDLAITKISRHLTDSQTYSDSVIKELEEVCGCISKFIYYNYDLVSSYDRQTIGTALANIVLDIYKLDKINRPSVLQLECKQAIFESVMSFRRKNKGLNNMYKFTDKKILELVENAMLPSQ